MREVERCLAYLKKLTMQVYRLESIKSIEQSAAAAAKSLQLCVTP